MKERLNEARREFDKACDEHIARYGMNARVYLSGRMSGLPEFVWWHRFSLAQYELEEKHKNVKVVNPAETFIANMPWLYRLLGYRLTLWYDLRLLKRCDMFTMVGDDWHLSRGARLERMKARQWGISELKLR